MELIPTVLKKRKLDVISAFWEEFSIAMLFLMFIDITLLVELVFRSRKCTLEQEPDPPYGACLSGWITLASIVLNLKNMH